MFQIDDNFLASLGLGSLSQEDKERMKNHIYETLEMRVGMTLASNMTDAQLDEFEELMNKNDEEGALKWLESNFPNYRQVVADELEKLKNEVKAAAPQILSDAGAAANPANGGTGPSPQSAPQGNLPNYNGGQQQAPQQPYQQPGQYQQPPYQPPSQSPQQPQQ